MNQNSVIRNIGTYLDALNKEEHILVVASDSTGGYLQDHVYLFAKDGVTKIDLRAVLDHTHLDSTTGGGIAEIFRSNYLWTDLFLSKITDLQNANWLKSVSLTGTIEDAIDGTTGERSVRLRPNGTISSKAQIQYPYLSLDFAKRAFYESKIRIETASSLAFHSGVNCDDIDVADSNTRKFNYEVCTTVNNNWWLRTADGTNKGSSDTLIAITTGRTYMFIDHLPSIPETDLYVGNLTVLQRTSNIPVDQSSAHNNIIKHSIKNNIGADRPIHIYPTRVRYHITDQWI